MLDAALAKTWKRRCESDQKPGQAMNPTSSFWLSTDPVADGIVSEVEQRRADRQIGDLRNR
jgi:hypothetical protein